MTISSGQFLLNPSITPLEVASIPILPPNLGTSEAWSRSSAGPLRITKSHKELATPLQ